MKNKQLKADMGIFGYMRCPKCKQKVSIYENSRILVKAESTANLRIKGLWGISDFLSEHNNPFCEWQNVLNKLKCL